MESVPGRGQKWAVHEIEAVIATALEGGRTERVYGNKHWFGEGKGEQQDSVPFLPRPSIALATLIGYDSTQRPQDIIALKWTNIEGDGIRLTQKKTGKEVWAPLSARTMAMLDETPKTSTHIVVNEVTGQPYKDKNEFGRVFRLVRNRAGVQSELQFRDLRRTGASELGDRGATGAEIVSITGHQAGSRILDTYVKPSKEAAMHAADKRWPEQRENERVQKKSRVQKPENRR